MERKNNCDTCRCDGHGLEHLNTTQKSIYYSSYAKSGLDEMSRSPKLLGLLLRDKIQKKFLSGHFFERDDINFTHLMGCAFDCLITLIKIVGQNFVVGAIYPKNTFFGNKIAVLKSATVIDELH